MGYGSRSASWMFEASMDVALLQRDSEYRWRIPPHGEMRVPGIIYGDESLVRAMDRKVYEQVSNVAMLLGIVGASYAMPDATGATVSRSAASRRSTPRQVA